MNPKDPIYLTKHPSSMPPLTAYTILQEKKDKVCVLKDNNARLIHYGWDNLTKYELDAIADCKRLVR